MNIIQKILYKSIRIKNRFFWWLENSDDGTPIGEQPNPIRLIQVNGKEMGVFRDDKGISYDLQVYGIREEHSTNLMKLILKEGDVVLEIGANIGYYALIETDKARKILAIEPSLDNYNLLRVNVEDHDNIDCVHAAISDYNGTIDFYSSERSNMGTTNKNPESHLFKGETRKVKCYTVDYLTKLFNLKPNIIRMDVQGAEYEIVKGMTDTLKQKQRMIIFMEFHFQMMSKDKKNFILDILEKNNFEIIRMFRGCNTTEARLRNDIDITMPISELRKNEDIMSGKEGTMEIFFQKDDGKD